MTSKKIFGIGIDLVMNSAIQNVLSKNYSIKIEEEQIQFVASRWAVKEAISKAIGRK